MSLKSLWKKLTKVETEDVPKYLCVDCEVKDRCTDQRKRDVYGCSHKDRTIHDAVWGGEE